MVTYQDAPLPVLEPGDRASDGARRLVADARAAAPMARGPFGPIVLRHADVAALALDRRLSGPQDMFLAVQGITDGLIHERVTGTLLFMEGDDHHRLRRLLSKSFTPRMVESLRPFARRCISELFDVVAADGRCDAIPTLCDPYPIPVIAELVGVPTERWRDLSRWARDFMFAIGFDVQTHRDRIERSIAEMDSFLADLIDARRSDPRDDLLSALIAVEEEGSRLTTTELINTVFMLLVAGTDTTRNQLGCMLHSFAEAPDQWERVRTDPGLVANAVEEAVRWEPAVGAMPRLALEDIEIGGVVVPAGTPVLLSSESANLDETVVPDGDRFDIGRTGASGWHLLTFGAGVHYCLGAALARLELQEALAELSGRMPRLSLDGVPRRSPPDQPISGYEHLPISWETTR
jgi:cytochrome P450